MITSLVCFDFSSSSNSQHTSHLPCLQGINPNSLMWLFCYCFLMTSCLCILVLHADLKLLGARPSCWTSAPHGRCGGQPRGLWEVLVGRITLIYASVFQSLQVSETVDGFSKRAINWLLSCTRGLERLILKLPFLSTTSHQSPCPWQTPYSNPSQRKWGRPERVRDFREGETISQLICNSKFPRIMASTT